MAYKDVMMLEDADVYHTFKKCKELGAVAMVHAENGHLIAEVTCAVRRRKTFEMIHIIYQQKTKDIVDEGITGPEGHLYSRPEEVSFVEKLWNYFT